MTPWLIFLNNTQKRIIIIIIICSSYIALFPAEASSKRFTYYYPWQTCTIRHLLNSPGSIHPLTRFKAPRVILVKRDTE